MAHLGAPDFPTPIGILRRREAPTYEEAVVAQIQAAERAGVVKLEDLLNSGDTWRVE